jgi:hypothetical protein
MYDKSGETRKKSGLLVDFVVSFLRLSPKLVTSNRFKTPSFSVPKHQQKKQQKLFLMLVHISTLINESYRVKDKQGRYMSQKEDYVNALNIMKDLVLYFDVRKGDYEHELLAILEVIQEQHGEIKSLYIQEFTGYSRSHVKRIVALFADRGWLVRTGGNKKTGYTYRLEHSN